MFFSSVCLSVVLAASPCFFQDTGTGGVAVEELPAVLFEIGELDPERVLGLLKLQFKNIGEVEIEGKALLVRAEGVTVTAIRQAIAKYRLGEQDPSEWLPLPQHAIALFKGENPRSLGAVFEEYCNLAEVSCVIASDLRAELERKPITIIGSRLLQPESASVLLQLALFQEGYFLDASPTKDGVALRLQSRRQPLATPLLVRADRVTAYATHHALHIQTVVSLPRTDIRSVSNICRQLIRDPNSQKIIPLGSSNEMLIMGAGPWVNDVARILTISDQARQEHLGRALKGRVMVTEVIALKHAKAQTVRDHVYSFYRTTKENPFGTTVGTDTRLNAIVLRCTTKNLPGILEFIAKLDVKK